MRRFSDNDFVDVYNDYDFKIYAPGNSGYGYALEPKTEEGEKMYVSMSFRDVRNISAKSGVFKTGKLRFEESIENDIYKQLKINPDVDKEYYTREQIEEMLLHPNDDVLAEIVAINDKNTLEKFLSLFIGLKNSNEYFLADKVEMYIRARIEEVENNIRKSELLVTPTKNETVEIETAVVEDEDVVEETQHKKTTTRKPRTKKTT